MFAIAITLLVLQIRVPQDAGQLAAGLAHLWSSYLAYGISFLLIGLVWANHHEMFDRIERADRLGWFWPVLGLVSFALLIVFYWLPTPE